MKRSGYRTIFHIYLICFISLLGAVCLAAYLFLGAITTQTPDGQVVRSDWPKQFTEDFQKQIVFVDNMLPQVTQAGIAELQSKGIGLQLLDASGREIYSYQKPRQAAAAYTSGELLALEQAGQTAETEMTAFIGTTANQGSTYAYILYFPVSVAKVTMYVNGERFAGGKRILVPIWLALLVLILLSGILYGLLTTKAMERLMTAVRDIAARRYIPVQEPGMFRDLYASLNTLDGEIRASDQLRIETERMREEWIANITHDLKTPLSPIKGYAELLGESGGLGEEQCQRYAGIMLKNVSYLEALMDDLKLVYQLDNGMLPLNRKEQNVSRFLKELVIELLNDPAYAKRTIHFESTADAAYLAFDSTLWRRAFGNLLINAFVHGDDRTEVTVRVLDADTGLMIEVADNGPGMSPELTAHLFERYYRGAGTEQKPEGSGLGLAIAKSVIELHGGAITVVSSPAAGTTFSIVFCAVKVN